MYMYTYMLNVDHNYVRATQAIHSQRFRRRSVEVAPSNGGGLCLRVANLVFTCACVLVCVCVCLCVCGEPLLAEETVETNF